MRKAVMRQTEDWVVVCDVCGRDQFSTVSCFICGRDACGLCRTVPFSGSAGDPVTLGVRVCRECQQHPEPMQVVKTILRSANLDLAAELARWRQAATRKDG